MPIIQLIVILAVIVLLLWLVNTYIPMAEPIKRVITFCTLLAIILWLLNVFGIFDLGTGYRIGHGHRP